MEVKTFMDKYDTKLLELITGYIDGELNEAETKRVEEVLEKSPQLRDFYVAEKRIKKVIRERLAIEKAPFHLRNRIRRQLARYGSRPSFWQLVYSLFEYRPAAASFAFAVIAFLVLLPVYQIVESNGRVPSRSALPAVREAELEGEIICLDCDLFSVNQKGTVTHDRRMHRPGLRANDGTVWTILQDDEDTPFQYNKLLRKHASLSGLIFENSRYIRVAAYKLL